MRSLVKILNIKYIALTLFVLALALFLLQCSEDPEPPEDPGLLRIYIDKQQIEDLNGLYLTVDRVDIVYTVDFSEEEVITLSDRRTTFNFAGLSNSFPAMAGEYHVEPGYITQIRLIISESQARIGNDFFPVKIPSGPQTGLKIIAAELEIEIVDGGTTEVTVQLNPDKSIINNNGIGYILKPVIKAILGDVTEPPPLKMFRPNMVVVSFTHEATDEEIQALISSVNGQVIDKVPGGYTWTIEIPEDDDEEEVAAQLEEDSIVVAATLNWIGYVGLEPTDEYFDPEQWPLYNYGQFDSWLGMNYKNDADIDATDAWDLFPPGSVGSYDVVIGIIDSGFNINHSDLRENVWLNTNELESTLQACDANSDGKVTIQEINLPAYASIIAPFDVSPNDGKLTPSEIEAASINNSDDDPGGGNGYIDDIFGWNYVSNDNDMTPTIPHGTLMAGIIGAKGNGPLVGGQNYGTAGVMWDVQLMNLAVVHSDETWDYKDAIKALKYAMDHGAQIVNMSIICWSDSAHIQRIVDQYNNEGISGMVESCCAYNLGRNYKGDSFGGYWETNGTKYYTWPAGQVQNRTDRRICAGASDYNDELVTISNRGPKIVDLVAPGILIWGLSPTGVYQNKPGGTSMSTAYVSGVAGLLMAHNASFKTDPAGVRQRILNTVDPISSLNGVVRTGGRLNARRALDPSWP